MKKIQDYISKVSLGLLLIPALGIGSFPNSVFAEDRVSLKKAASNEEVITYKVIGGLTICNALNLGVDFKKAQEIAVRTYINLLVAKHDKKIINEKSEEQVLSENNLIYGSQFMIIADATNRCPKEIPDEVKEAVEEQYKKINNELKKNNGKNKKKNKKKR